MSSPPQGAVAPCQWLCALFVPPLVLSLLQAWGGGVLPGSGPWGAPDRVALTSFAGGTVVGSPTPAISIDPAASMASAWWILALLTYGLAATRLIGPSMAGLRSVLPALVALGAVHAVIALALAPFALDWPTPCDSVVARGTFVSQNQAAAFWSLLLPVAVLMWVRYGSPWGWAAAALSVAVVCSNSRGGVLCAAAVCLPLAWWFLPARRRWWWVTGGVAMIGLAAWAVDVRPLEARFSELSSQHEVSFRGRLSIWRAAAPLIPEVGPWGSGAGTSMLAWRRAGETTFEPQPVGHLHSDPLEFLLEDGWAGALLVAGGAALAAVLVLRRSPPGRWRRTLVAGPALGLATLGLHGCADFLLSNEAIALTAVLLAVIIAGSLVSRDPDMARSSSAHGQPLDSPQPKARTLPERRGLPALVGAALPMACIAVLIATLPWLERHEAADRVFVHLSRLATQRDGAASVQRRRAIDLALSDAASAAASGRWDEMADARLLALDAELALERGEVQATLAADATAKSQDTQPLEPAHPGAPPQDPLHVRDSVPGIPANGTQHENAVHSERAVRAADATVVASPSRCMPEAWTLARALLIQAGLRCPAEPRAWLARARLALDADPPQGAAAEMALERALAWGPAWMVGQAQAWNCLAMPGAQAIPREQRQELERRLLAPDLPQPLLAGRVAGEDLGVATLERLLLYGHPVSLASFAPWLRVHGTLQAWFAARAAQSALAPAAIAPIAALAAAHAGLAGVPLALATTSREREAQAAEIQDVGLAVPTTLADALGHDGPPWSWWAVALDPFNDTTRERLRQLGDANQRWAAAWIARAEQATHILAGDAQGLGAGADPLLVQGALAAARAGRVRFAVPGEADRLALLLVRLRRPQWTQVSGAMWAWVLCDERSPPMQANLAGWMGLCVDGAWVGWRRGLIDLRRELPPGLHRVAFLDP